MTIPKITLQEKIEQMIKPMLRMQLYVALTQPLKPVDEILPFMPDHLEYMIQLENAGVLFASGPFVEENLPVGQGLTIIRANDLEQAQHYMDEEPLIKNGLRRYELFQWELREGRFGLELNFATGKYKVI